MCQPICEHVWPKADKHRCAYCLTAEAISGTSLSIDHILPRSREGLDEFENLCMCCRPCNECKARRTTGQDPLTGTDVPLFHPRRQNWSDHFTWAAGDAMIEGLTPSGRATIVALRMNNPVVVAARRRWVDAGWHPPAGDVITGDQ